MSTMNARPERLSHPEIAGSSENRLRAAIKLHYQIARHCDEQLDQAYREVMNDEKASELVLNRLTTERNEAHEIYRLYLSEYICRRKQASISSHC